MKNLITGLSIFFAFNAVVQAKAYHCDVLEHRAEFGGQWMVPTLTDDNGHVVLTLQAAAPSPATVAFKSVQVSSLETLLVPPPPGNRVADIHLVGPTRATLNSTNKVVSYSQALLSSTGVPDSFQITYESLTVKQSLSQAAYDLNQGNWTHHTHDVFTVKCLPQP